MPCVKLTKIPLIASKDNLITGIIMIMMIPQFTVTNDYDTDCYDLWAELEIRFIQLNYSPVAIFCIKINNAVLKLMIIM